MTIITQTSDNRPSFFPQTSTYFSQEAMVEEIKAKPDYFFQLSAKRLFGDLTRESRRSLEAIKQRKQFPKGAHLFVEGDMPCCVYLPVKGKVQISSNDKNLVQFIEPDKIFGLTEAISNLPYQINAETLTPCVCECIGRDEFISFLQNEPKVCFRLAQMLGSNLQEKYQIFISSII